jgi:hypothetical protein
LLHEWVVQKRVEKDAAFYHVVEDVVDRLRFIRSTGVETEYSKLEQDLKDMTLEIYSNEYLDLDDAQCAKIIKISLFGDDDSQKNVPADLSTLFPNFRILHLMINNLNQQTLFNIPANVQELWLNYCNITELSVRFPQHFKDLKVLALCNNEKLEIPEQVLIELLDRCEEIYLWFTPVADYIDELPWAKNIYYLKLLANGKATVHLQYPEHLENQILALRLAKKDKIAFDNVNLEQRRDELIAENTWLKQQVIPETMNALSTATNYIIQNIEICGLQ